uniref:VWFA domain-containing protein n=1 Tax=Oreochromis niloticus TaxID=8128 RepID=A0A669B5G4_ORENI
DIGGFSETVIVTFCLHFFVVADPKKSDVVFLIDGSYDSLNGFEEIRSFIEKTVESLNLGNDRDQVAVVQYSRDATANFYLNSYSSKNDVLNSIRTMRHKFGRPLNIGKALEFVRDNVFSASVGGRRADLVPQYLYVFSGGRSGDDVRGPAQSLKDNGIKTFSIGTENADTLEMQTISYTPAHYFYVTNYNNLQSLDPSVEAMLRDTSVTAEAGFQSADIVFLLDGSDDMQPSEQQTLEFVREFVKQIEIGPKKAQVALIQYSTEPTTEFLLNKYSLKDDIINHLDNMKLKGGSTVNTGVALDYVKNNVFTASSGSRALHAVPQILILFSGRNSNDEILGPLERLRNAGIVLFGIGVNNADRFEMEQLAPRAMYFIKNTSDFPHVREQLLSVISSLKSTISPDVGNIKRDIDVVFLLDGSDATRTGFPAMRDFVQKQVETLSVDDGKDRVSVVQYSSDPAVQFYLNTYTTKREVLDSVRGLRHKGGRPLNTGAALRYLRDNVFTASAGSRRPEGVPQVLILITGGRSFDSIDEPASALKQLGVLTIAIGTRGSDSTELQTITGEPSHAVSVSDFTDLPNVQEQLSSVMSTVLMRVTPLTPTVTGKDVVFLLDGSDTTRTGFPAMRDFVQTQVETLSVDDGKDRVSVVQYSSDAAVQFYLNTYTTKREVLDSVRGLRHKGGRPLNTGAALRYLRDNVFTASAGSRRPEGVPQVLILITGGRSFDSIDEPASALKQLGVLTIAIGTRGSDPRELQTITGEPSYALSVSELTDLPKLQQQLESPVEETPIEVFIVLSYCLFSVSRDRKDIVFLLDGSDGTRNGFPAMRDFVERVVEKLNVGENKDHVSVVQYSREPEVHFYLNTYTTGEDVVDSVRGLRHRGGRPLNTGAALQYVRDNVFTNSSGSRRLQGVPQILILLTGGRSFDNVDSPASALKQQGIYVIGIGTRTSDARELQKISYEPSYALSVSEFTDLPSVQEKLSSVMNTVIVRATPMTPTVTVVRPPAGKDVVFLLDGSDTTRTGFPAMRDFVQKQVETLSVDDGKDRVSVVQYSSDPAVQFYLNTYTTKREVLDSVRGLRHKGGRPLNTGAALRYLRDNVFTASAGSRRPEGVPQVLILITGGRSFDSIDEPASALKQLGVLTIAIGTRGSDPRELQTITGEPSHAVSVSDFTDLPNVQEQLSSVMSTVLMRVTPLTPTVTGKNMSHLHIPVDFVQKQVETLSVDDGKDRVSVVQYSSDPAVQFYLNTYTTKREVLDSVRGLRHKGGRPLNTGAALRYLRDNVFTASAGSRRPEGVPQVLILITGGRSFDSIDEPASALKQLGVLTIAIGTRGSDPRELQTITGEPSHAVSVSDFTDLPNVQEQLSSVMSTVLMRVTPLTPTVTGKNMSHLQIPVSW